MTDAAPGEFELEVDGVTLIGDLVVPPRAFGLVVFAHGSGSSRFSPRNRRVAARLNRAGLGTLLLDLLTTAEAAEDEVSGRHRFDIRLLAGRVAGIVDRCTEDPATAGLGVGLFGASTGAAAALVAAAMRPSRVRAVVSRGGRPDLGQGWLGRVRAPTLLIVGGADPVVLDLNRDAMARLRCESRLEVVGGAGHLFEEPGAMDRVAGLAAAWLAAKLA